MRDFPPIICLIFLLALAFPAPAKPDAGRLKSGGESSLPPTPPIASTASVRDVFETTLGDIVASVDAEAAPKTVTQFMKLVRSGAYDTTHVHFADRGALVQFSNVENRRLPLTPEQKAAARPLEAEFGGRPMKAGSLIMARLPDEPDSGSSSFSILLADAPHLEGKYTVFGRVTHGMDVALAIANVEVDGEKRPLRAVEIEKAVAVDSEDLARMTLRGPILSPPKSEGVPARFLGFLAAMLVVGVVHYFLFDRISPRTSRSLLLVWILMGFFALFVALLPADPLYRWVPVVLFVALLAVIKLMGRFEGKE